MNEIQENNQPSEIKTHPFPVLSPYGLDYASGKYEAEVKKRVGEKSEVSVRHLFQGNCLVSRLLEDNIASFACIVSLPSTMYRRLHVSDSREFDHVQTVDYSDSGDGHETSVLESPMFRPIILTKKPLEREIVDSDNLNDLWRDGIVSIPDGSIIAYDDWARFGGNIGGLLFIDKGDDLDNGQIKVSLSSKGGGRFHVHVGKDLHDHLKENREGSLRYQRRSVLIHALSEGFGLLKAKKDDSSWNWKMLSNLRLVSNALKDRDLDDWEGDDFSPSEAATALYPHEFPDNERVEEYDE